jgi:hypothetical protein
MMAGVLGLLLPEDELLCDPLAFFRLATSAIIDSLESINCANQATHARHALPAPSSRKPNIQNDCAHVRIGRQSSQLRIEPPASLVQANLRNFATAAVFRIPATLVKPTDEIDSNRSRESCHVVVMQLIFQSREEFAIPTAFRFDYGRNRVEHVISLVTPNCLHTRKDSIIR